MGEGSIARTGIKFKEACGVEGRSEGDAAIASGGKEAEGVGRGIVEEGIGAEAA